MCCVLQKTVIFFFVYAMGADTSKGDADYARSQPQLVHRHRAECFTHHKKARLYFFSLHSPSQRSLISLLTITTLFSTTRVPTPTRMQWQVLNQLSRNVRRWHHGKSPSTLTDQFHVLVKTTFASTTPFLSSFGEQNLCVFVCAMWVRAVDVVRTVCFSMISIMIQDRESQYRQLDLSLSLSIFIRSSRLRVCTFTQLYVSVIPVLVCSSHVMWEIVSQLQH